MIEIILTYHLVNKWQTQNGISILGNRIFNGKIVDQQTTLNEFENGNSEKEFLEILQKTDGHFAIIIETATQIFIAVDRLRTFPLFILKDENTIHITDKISKITSWNIPEIENFKKVYCTLENQTLLQNWHQLQVGEYAIIDKENFTFQIKTYYQHTIKVLDNTTSLIEDLKKVEEELITNCIAIANNRTILIPLSGGYDSRYLLAMLHQYNYSNIECYTYGKKDSYEVETAKKVCEKLNIKWHFIEYTNELLELFFTEEWQQYSAINHHYTSLPHEQDFFALLYLKQNNLLPKNAIVMNGFCQDLHAGSIIEPIKNFDLRNFIEKKYQLSIDVSRYENSWNGYQQWFIKNRVSKFIINAVRLYEYFGLDFYLPFWQKNWIAFWYALPIEKRLNQQFYNEYIFNNYFKTLEIDFKKPKFDTTNNLYEIKKLAKSILPAPIIKWKQSQNQTNKKNDVNNTIFLYNELYNHLKNKPNQKDFRINNIHALYFLENLKEKLQL